MGRQKKGTSDCEAGGEMVKSKPSYRKRPLNVTTIVSSLFQPPSSKAHDKTPLAAGIPAVFTVPSRPFAISCSLFVFGSTFGVVGLFVASAPRFSSETAILISQFLSF
jgi:hypothetical protein